MMRSCFFITIFYSEFCNKKEVQMAELTNTQKKEWAKTLFLKENLTQQEIADKVGVSRVTVNKWINTGKWEEHKVGITLTR